ncbi:MAG: hypothetical protein M1828_001638 [Chrysothrix sp. TS-e1954]|nr:MAG: hypothetical protein M1828_001638 [Chrysothrix sp. TS-e1954]
MASRDVDMDAYGGLGPTIMCVIWTELSVALIFMAMRLYVGMCIKKPLGWDFVWAATAMIFGIAGQGFLVGAVANGMGNHVELLDPHQIDRAVLFDTISISILLIGYCPGKIAIIAFLLRIQGPTHVKKARFLYFLAASNVLLNFTQAIIIWFQCDPPAKLWNSNLPGKCSTADHVNSDLGYLQGSWSSATDLILATYSPVVFRRLQLPVKQKIGIMCLLGAGILACVCGCIRTVQIHRVRNVTDRTGNLAYLSLWAWTEFWILVIAGSLPLLRPLFARMISRLALVVPRRNSTQDVSPKDSKSSRIPMASPNKVSEEPSDLPQQFARSESQEHKSEIFVTKHITVEREVRGLQQQSQEEPWLGKFDDFASPSRPISRTIGTMV